MELSLQGDMTAASLDGTGDPLSLNGSVINGKVVLNCEDAETGNPETVTLSLTPEELAMLGLSANEITGVQLNTEPDVFDHTIGTPGPVISLAEGKQGVSSVTLLSETDPNAARVVTEETNIGRLVSAARGTDTSTKATIQAAVDVFICKTCGESFHTSDDLERHVLIHEEDQERFIGKDLTEEDFTTLNCGICGKSFMSESDFEKHRSFTCEKCRKCYTSKHSYLSHKQTHTGEAGEFAEGEDVPSTKVDVMGYVRRLTDRNPLDCIYCGKGYSNKLKLKMHRRIHYSETPFQCIFCDQSYSSQNDLVVHMPTHTRNEEYPYICLTCDKSFNSRGYLTSHKLQHSEVKECETESSNESYFKLKGKTKMCKIPSEIDQFKCLICAEEFGNKTAALSHAKTHAGEKPFMCSLCGKCFQLKSKVLRHIRRHAAEPQCKQTTPPPSSNTMVERASQAETGNLKYKCDYQYCEERFDLITALRRHRVTAHTGASVEKTYKCIYCKRKFASLQSLIVHKLTHNKKHQCQYCEKSFNSMSGLSRHSRIHSGKSHQCDDCGKSFVSELKLVEHRHMHTGEKLFTCIVCEKAFSSRMLLRAHKKIHSKEHSKVRKQYKCHLCDKITTNQFTLKMHMKVHTGEKPYICEHCGERFAFMVTLRTHAMTHTKDRPFSCDLCDKDFRLAFNLKIHMREHNGEKPYMCEICGKGFNFKMHLTKHVNRHAKPESYKCEYCDKVLENEAELNGHVCD